MRFAPSVGGIVALKTALPSLRSQPEIRGPGAGDPAVRRSSTPGTRNFRVFTVADDAIVTVSGLKVSNGRQQVGAGIGDGGPTQTVALAQDSPAIDAVDAGCPPPTTDQRGVSRPRDGDGDGTPFCDIGAYELEAAP